VGWTLIGPPDIDQTAGWVAFGNKAAGQFWAPEAGWCAVLAKMYLRKRMPDNHHYRTYDKPFPKTAK
jgi:hypothetical protein